MIQRRGPESHNSGGLLACGVAEAAVLPPESHASTMPINIVPEEEGDDGYGST